MAILSISTRLLLLNCRYFRCNVPRCLRWGDFWRLLMRSMFGWRRTKRISIMRVISCAIVVLQADGNQVLSDIRWTVERCYNQNQDVGSRQSASQTPNNRYVACLELRVWALDSRADRKTSRCSCRFSYPERGGGGSTK